jgi:hypothetical protein
VFFRHHLPHLEAGGEVIIDSKLEQHLTLNHFFKTSISLKQSHVPPFKIYNSDCVEKILNYYSTNNQSDFQSYQLTQSELQSFSTCSNKKDFQTKIEILYKNHCAKLLGQLDYRCFDSKGLPIPDMSDVECRLKRYRNQFKKPFSHPNEFMFDLNHDLAFIQNYKKVVPDSYTIGDRSVPVYSLLKARFDISHQGFNSLMDWGYEHDGFTIMCGFDAEELFFKYNSYCSKENATMEFYNLKFGTHVPFGV